MLGTETVMCFGREETRPAGRELGARLVQRWRLVLQQGTSPRGPPAPARTQRSGLTVLGDKLGGDSCLECGKDGAVVAGHDVAGAACGGGERRHF